MNHTPKYEEMMTLHFNRRLWHQDWMTLKLSVLYVFFFLNTPYVRPQFLTWGLWGGFYSILRVQRIKFHKKKWKPQFHEVGFSVDGHIYKFLQNFQIYTNFFRISEYTQISSEFSNPHFFKLFPKFKENLAHNFLKIFEYKFPQIIFKMQEKFLAKFFQNRMRWNFPDIFF